MTIAGKSHLSNFKLDVKLKKTLQLEIIPYKIYVWISLFKDGREPLEKDPEWSSIIVKKARQILMIVNFCLKKTLPYDAINC